MMKRIVSFGFVFLLFKTFSFAQVPSQLFQQALLKENGEGDLKAAVALYEKIVGDVTAERGLRAKAQLHIGMCWEKMGRQEAIAAYQKVAEEFSDQTVLVAEARERLSALKFNDISSSEKGLVTRKILEGGVVEIEGAPSPDGKYLSYVDINTGNLAVLDIASREKRNITNLQNENWDQFAEFSKWSPDSKSLVYTWYNEAGNFELRTVNIDGSSMRIIYPGTNDIYWIQPSAWSQDNKFVVALVAFKGGKNTIVKISLSDLKSQEIKSLDFANDWPNVLLSMDGKSILYDPRQSKSTYSHDIYRINLERKEETPLIIHPNEDILLGLTSDDRNVLFLSDRTGSLDAWVAPLMNDEVGEPSKIRADIGSIIPLGITQTGSFFYGIRTGTTNLYTATIDFNTGNVLQPPEKIITTNLGDDNESEWSPDGKYLAYISERGNRSFNNPNFLMIRFLETGKEQQFFLDDYPYVSTPRWSADGKNIILMCMSFTTGKRATCLFNRESSEFSIIKELANPPFESNLMGHLYTPDGNGILYWYRDGKEKIFKFIIYNLQSKQEKEIYQNIWSYDIGGFGDAMAYSPDGKWFAYTLRNIKDKIQSLYIIPETGGEPKEIVRTENKMIGYLNWLPDSRHLLYYLLGENGGLYFVDLEGGTPQKIDIETARLRNLRLHPDGKQIIYSGGSRKYEVWAMENYLP